MIKTSLACAVLVLFSWMRSEPAMADAAVLRVCSAKEKNNTLLVTVVHRNYALYPLGDSWLAKGWWTIPPGECQTVGSLAIGMPVFLSVSRTSGIGPLINVYHLHTGPIPLNKPVGVERFFCVQRGQFERVAPVIDGHTTCPPGWHQQLFNLYIFVKLNVLFQLTL